MAVRLEMRVGRHAARTHAHRARGVGREGVGVAHRFQAGLSLGHGADCLVFDESCPFVAFLQA
jgi:hypothetical protein